MRTTTRHRHEGPKLRRRFAYGAALICLLLTQPTRLLGADEPKSPATLPADTSKQIELVVDPAPEPFPAMRYNLLLPKEARKPGNAAPIYLRIVYEKGDNWLKQLESGSDDFLDDVPLEAMPLPEAGKYLERFADVTVQLAAAARRADCQWEYVFENQDPLLISLADSQSMRAYARLLSIKARYEIRKGQFDQAVSTIQDNLAMARHIASGPFLVNRLIGIAMANLALDRVQELMQQPGAPNLYWALASLPRPLIPLDGALVMERQLLELKFPELADLERPRSATQWQLISQSMRAWAVQVVDLELSTSEPQRSAEAHKKTREATTAPQLQVARSYLHDQCGLSDETVQAASDAEIEVRYTLALHREMTDNWQKLFSLPYPISLARATVVFKSLKEDVSRRELFPLSSSLLFEFGNAIKAQARLDRHIARLQVQEALRMHAAATGQLPARLEEVAIVPVPVDPVTGGPFHYSLQNDVAVLTVAGPIDAADDRETFPVKIRLRSKN